MAQLDFDLIVKLGGPVLAAIATKAISDWLEKRPRLVCFYLHASEVTLRLQAGDSVPVRTHAVVVVNQGREPANNVRIDHFNLPDFDVYPDINYEIRNLPGGTRQILIASLAPREQITINYLYFSPMTYVDVNSFVGSDDGAARVLKVLPTPQLPAWMTYSVWTLAAVGVVAIATGIWLLAFR